MKTFSELLDINCNIPIEIGINAITHNGIPNACVSINDTTLYDAPVDNNICLCYSVQLRDLMQISVTMSKKKYDVNVETAIIIDSVKIDGHEYIPECNHLISYINDHGINTATNYLGYNGTWTLPINVPYYRWKHHFFNNGWLMEI